eukprot:scaffold103_cov36-Phaeocystis_antarctica.AAC.1
MYTGRRGGANVCMPPPARRPWTCVRVRVRVRVGVRVLGSGLGLGPASLAVRGDGDDGVQLRWPQPPQPRTHL